MKATKIKLKNFRSFGPDITTILLEADITGIVGVNSSGKTALLESVRKIFGSNSLERTISKSDFHIPGGIDPKDIDIEELFIEVVFEFEKKHNQGNAYLDDANEDRGIPSFFDNMVIDAPGALPYLRVRLTSKWERDPRTVEGSIDTRLVYIMCPEGEEENDSNVFAFPNHKRSLIQSFYVPAIRQPSEQLKFVSGSVLFRLFNKIKWPDTFEQEFKERLDDVNNLFDGIDDFSKIKTSLASLWSDYNKDRRYNEATIAFGSSDIDSILRKLEIEFSPTNTDRPFRISELGEGYRSLFYLTLVSTLLKLEDELDVDEGEKPILTLLLIEEPENHIAPQLLGRVLKNLSDLSKRGNVQLILSSHAPSIISRIEPEAIRHLRLDEIAHKTVSSCIVLPKETEEAFKFVKEAVKNYPEIYFSKLVVIGEGDSEVIIFKMLARVYGKDFDDHFITVAPIGGRYVNHIWKLLNQLSIPHVTLLDLDRERSGGGWGRIKYALEQLILNNPNEKDNILTREHGGVLGDSVFKTMHKWKNKMTRLMDYWIRKLEGAVVFFCAPLDLDFVMLCAFPDEYKKTAKHGPQIPEKDNDPLAFEEKVKNSIKATLKSESAIGETYTEEERELMIWYNYLFLGRGKPSTHIHAVSEISDENLKDKMPDLLKKMFAEIERKILKIEGKILNH